MAIVLSCFRFAGAQDSQYEPKRQLIPAPGCFILQDVWTAGTTYPCTADSLAAWLKDITHWREERRIRIGYRGDRYDNLALKWTQSSFMQPQMMAHER